MSEHVYEFQKIKQTVDKIADDTLIKVLDSKKYSASKTAEWIDKIGSVMVPQLRDLSPNFKYIISTVILQKTGAGLHSEVTANWDANTDGAIFARFENDTLICMCTVIGVAI